VTQEEVRASTAVQPADIPPFVEKMGGWFQSAVASANFGFK
jgi:hypothetical protein